MLRPFKNILIFLFCNIEENASLYESTVREKSAGYSLNTEPTFSISGSVCAAAAD